MNLVTTDEKKPPRGVGLSKVGYVPPHAIPRPHDWRLDVEPTLAQQCRLINNLQELEMKFRAVTLEAGNSGEMKLAAELEKQWDSYVLLIAPLSARAPAKLFE
jgi:hypothetical protein